MHWLLDLIISRGHSVACVEAEERTALVHIHKNTYTRPAFHEAGKAKIKTRKEASVAASVVTSIASMVKLGHRDSRMHTKLRHQNLCLLAVTGGGH